jgi:hypothetical protein
LQTTRASSAERLARRIQKAAAAELKEAWHIPRRLGDLRKLLEGDAHDLKQARFSLKNAGLVPAAGACAVCPKRTGAEPVLFEDLDAADRCLDHACYVSKQHAWLLKRYEGAKKKHGSDLILLNTSHSGYGSDELPAFGEPVRTRSAFGWGDSSKPKKGWIPALVVAEYGRIIGRAVGNVIWVKPKPATERSEADDVSPEAVLARAESLLRRRRLRTAVPALLAQAESAKAPAVTVLVRLVSAFGGPPRREYRNGYDPGYCAPESKGRQPWPAFADPKISDTDCRQKVWAAVQEIVGKRLDLRNTFDDFKWVEAEAKAYAKLTERDWPAIWKEARQKHPASKALQAKRAAVKS